MRAHSGIRTHRIDEWLLANFLVPTSQLIMTYLSEYLQLLQYLGHILWKENEIPLYTKHNG